MRFAHAASALLLLASLYSPTTEGFVVSKSGVTTHRTSSTQVYSTTSDETAEEIRLRKKKELLGLLGTGKKSSDVVVPCDPVLADPITKIPLRIEAMGPVLSGEVSSPGIKLSLKPVGEEGGAEYMGRTNTFYNLLEPVEETTSSSSDDGTGPALSETLDQLRVFIPPPLRSALATAGVFNSEDYVPMRDLFTSPSVSFAYERGWRQGFAQGGFPGADEEYKMVREYFEPVTVGMGATTVVDMSCATGLFTRRLAKSNDYTRVIACDYSESMLQEARRRINADPDLKKRDANKTRLDLVRCDVGKIPMRSESINALHAGAAMHCWPDLDAGLSEIYKVLKPGGRYFATTFLSTYFGALQNAEGGQTGVSRQAFQYFESVDKLRNLLLKAGFENEKIDIEVLEPACVVIRCEK